MEHNDEIEIDLLKLMKALWKKAWAIVLVAVLFGSAMFAYGKATYVPSYTAETVLYASYVNTQDFSVGESSGNIAQNSLSEARSMVNTCVAVLNTRMTLEAVAEASGLELSHTQLSGMVTAAAVNNTELFTITVTGPDAEQAALVANTIGEVLPEMVSMVNRNSDVGVIDTALIPESPNADSIVKNAAVAAVLGAFLVCAVVVVKELIADWKKAGAVNIEKDTEAS